MRAVGLHSDVIAVTSRAYATGCVLVRSGNEAFCIDSPIFPDELEILPAIAEQAEFNVVGLLATHAVAKTREVIAMTSACSATARN